MGKYDGLLLCSDFDGTLFYEGVIPEANLRAIAEFEKEGGRFTLCSGRWPEVLREKELPLTLHTPMICLNGSMIYDHEQGRTLFEGLTDGSALISEVKTLLESWEDRIARISVNGPSFHEHMCVPLEREKLFRLMAQPIYKVVTVAKRCGDKEEDWRRGKELRDFCRNIFAGRFLIARSWDVGVEVQDARYSKGRAARQLCQMLGAEKLICVGDFENDLDMLREADLSFAVGNACEEAKACAHEVLCHARDGAIADLIARL